MIAEEFKHLQNAATKKDFKKFGFTMGVALIAIAAIVYFKTGRLSLYLGSASALFFLLAVIVPVWLKYVYLIWMGFAVVMGFIMTRVILGILFFLVFSPVGLVLRLLRKDPLNQRLQPEKSTYWIKRTAPEEKTDAERQF